MENNQILEEIKLLLERQNSQLTQINIALKAILIELGEESCSFDRIAMVSKNE